MLMAMNVLIFMIPTILKKTMTTSTVYRKEITGKGQKIQLLQKTKKHTE